ncbi:MAG: hypothetical protein EZS28_034463, partial [Streblomastix strix]
GTQTVDVIGIAGGHGTQDENITVNALKNIINFFTFLHRGRDINNVPVHQQQRQLQPLQLNLSHLKESEEQLEAEGGTEEIEPQIFNEGKLQFIGETNKEAIKAKFAILNIDQHQPGYNPLKLVILEDQDMIMSN